MHKHCTKCGQMLPMDLFGRSSYSKDGLRYMCKPCASKEGKKYHHKNKQRINSRKRLRPASERQKLLQEQWAINNPGRVKAHVKKWAKVNRHKMRAHWIVKSCLKYGTMVKPSTCFWSGDCCSGRIEAHHCDYTKPREVMWLCNKHHNAWHKVFIAKE